MQDDDSDEIFDWDALDAELLKEDKNWSNPCKVVQSTLSTTQRSVSSQNDTIAVKPETLKNDLHQNSKNTFNYTDTTCISTTPENSEVPVHLMDAKLSFKDI